MTRQVPDRIADDSRQRGVALLIVLVLLASLSVIALAMTTTMRVSIERTRSTEALDQMRWYAAGAEALAISVHRRQWEADPGRDTRLDPWLAEPVTFPIENGLIEATITDATRCFNLNSLVIGEAGTLEADPEARERFMLLLEEVGLDGLASESVASAIIDWLDSDTRPETTGAEDGDYARLDIAYRTGNTLLADLSELRAMMGISPALLGVLAPHLCVRPETTPTRINLNLVTLADAPVVYAAFAGQLTIDEVERLIGVLPEEGLESIDQFWALPDFEGKQLPDGVRERFVLYSQWMSLKTNITYDQAFILQESLLRVGNDGRARVVRRRMGPE